MNMCTLYGDYYCNTERLVCYYADYLLYSHNPKVTLTQKLCLENLSTCANCSTQSNFETYKEYFFCKKPTNDNVRIAQAWKCN